MSLYATVQLCVTGKYKKCIITTTVGTCIVYYMYAIEKHNQCNIQAVDDGNYVGYNLPSSVQQLDRVLISCIFFGTI